MFRKSLGVAILAVLVGTFVSAQVFRQPLPVTSPIVFAGDDFGFRVEAMDGDRILGQLVVQVDGEWVEVRTSALPTGQTN